MRGQEQLSSFNEEGREGARPIIRAIQMVPKTNATKCSSQKQSVPSNPLETKDNKPNSSNRWLESYASKGIAIDEARVMSLMTNHSN